MRSSEWTTRHTSSCTSSGLAQCRLLKEAHRATLARNGSGLHRNVHSHILVLHHRGTQIVDSGYAIVRAFVRTDKQTVAREREAADEVYAIEHKECAACKAFVPEPIAAHIVRGRNVRFSQ